MCYWIMLQKDNFSWSFSYNSLIKFHGKKFGSLTMNVLYPYYNEVCFKGAALYLNFLVVF